MDISGEPDIQNINIVINSLQFFSQCGVFLSFFYIIAKKIRHFLYKNPGPLCILHHCKLCSCIQGIKQKMWINLWLKIFQLCFFQMIFHKKLPLHHLLLFLHTCFRPCHIQIKILYHCIKRSGYCSQFILCICIVHLYMEISLTYQLCCLCHIGKGNKHISGGLDEQKHSTGYNYDHNNWIAYLQISHHCTKYCISTGVLLKHQVIQFVNRWLDISVKLCCIIIFTLILLNVPSSFGSYRFRSTVQICFRHFPDIPFQKLYGIIDIIFIKFLKFISVFCLILIIIKKCLRTLNLKILIHIILYLLKYLWKFGKLCITGINIIHLLHGIIDPHIKKHIHGKKKDSDHTHLYNDFTDQWKIFPAQLLHPDTPFLLISRTTSLSRKLISTL